MQFLCITALLLSAVAARPDSWRPWQDEKFPPAGGPKLGADSKHGDGEQSVQEAPEDRDGGSGRDWPEGDSGHPVWPHEMPTWLPNRPGKGNPQGPMKGTDGNDRRPGRPSQVPNRGKRQAPGFIHDQPGRHHSRPSKHFGRPRGPHRGKGPSMRNPGPTGTVVFSPLFKVDNVTFQNVTSVPLKEGENLFLMPKGGKHGPPENGQYVKLIYNTTEPSKVSIEYGVVKPMYVGELVGEENNPEGDDL
ncbi:cleavage and polyadenylation specificity factor subunit 6-like isoform X2 [Toxotes jaculatrix]|uniref:cleavage and polyadenylation specificity factor subunit 6-like isoform X2 n=1 Tax=Toxotes jaculatrix TaxID=941984 RepID=UPI001B3B12C7|nr:cleavage and polyadenylation specificity factor subunit 6-like isoform X2 [Toxotes jaculatrix]